MKLIRRLWCRAFQTGFRLALPLLPYREPMTLDSTSGIPGVLKQVGASSVLLVTDRSVRSLGLIDSTLAALEAAGIRCTIYDAVVPNPTIANVEEAREAYLRGDCSALIAIGGGSAMDCAKACGARIARPDKTISQLKGILRVHRRTPPIIAVPTTAGTGSEATLAAVITDPEKKHKYPVNDFPLIPSYAVLDPSLTVGLPPFITATTGMDAMTHAVEAYIGRSTNALTRAMSEEAVALIHRYLERAYNDGTDLEARAAMLRAAYCAGVSFTRSYVGYVHGIAHSLGGQYGTPHGLANSVILPYFLDEYGAAIHGKLARLAIRTGIVPEGTPTAEAAERFIARIKQLNEHLGIPRTLDGIRVEDIPVMAAHADRESNPLYPVPVLMDAKKLQTMYYRIMTPVGKEKHHDDAGDHNAAGGRTGTLRHGRNAADRRTA